MSSGSWAWAFGDSSFVFLHIWPIASGPDRWWPCKNPLGLGQSTFGLEISTGGGRRACLCVQLLKAAKKVFITLCDSQQPSHKIPAQPPVTT